MLTPDILLKINQRVFYPTPSDRVMIKVKQEELNQKGKESRIGLHRKATTAKRPSLGG